MTSIKEKYEKYKPKKFLGQNFLVDKNIAKKIVNSLEINHQDVVIEIGPGQGVLTNYISALTSNLIAIEIDKTIYTKLSYEYGKRIKLIHSDFLKLNIKKELNEYVGSARKIKVIGNIPYNITSEILFKLYESKEIIYSVVLMMQKEVAQRLVALPNSKEYGILSIMTQIHSTPKILFTVPPTAFFPKPKVDSSVLKFEFAKDHYEIKDEKMFNLLVKKSFGKRRKTMRNSLKDFFEISNISPQKIDFDFSRRPESVTIKEFVDLSNSICSKKNNQW